MGHPEALYYHLRGASIVAPWIAYLTAADLALSLLLPFKPFAPTFVFNLSSRIASSVWRWIQVIFERFNGANITFSGDKLPCEESAIVVCNHVAWADFYMIQALAVKAGMLGRCRWFAKIQLRMVPFLGWGLWAMGMPMVTRNWMRDQGELNRVFRGIVSKKWPVCKSQAESVRPKGWHTTSYKRLTRQYPGLISFSEATRFTPKKYEETAAWCKKNDRPLPLHLLYPRTKGFVTTVQHLRQAPHVKAVYDLTIAYQHGDTWHEAPSMWDTLRLAGLSSGGGYKFHVRTRRFPLEELPHTDQELAKWLEQRWIEKGEWLEMMRREWSKTD